MTHRLLAVHAHPDDESITMGGTLARSVAAGDQVTLVTCTLGEEGEIIPPELALLAADAADQLGGYRHGELDDACRALGIPDHRYLGGIGRYRDSGMAGSPAHDDPRALVHAAAGGPHFESAVGALLAVLDAVAPEVVVSYDADGGYGHPDHIAAHEIARAAAQRAPSVRRFFAVIRPEDAVRRALAGFVPAPGYAAPLAADLGFPATSERVSVAVPVLDQRDRHRAALAAHATQIDVLPNGFALSNRIAQPLLDTEYFALVDGEPMPASDAPGTDLFAGLR
jgi:N-acetyl-1-D-myo-inositol-2-amino-2-deoxy-alpha-D-glucopyranoside deacetylase